LSYTVRKFKNLAKLLAASLIATTLVALSPINAASAATTAGTVYVPCDPADNHPAFIGTDRDIYVTPGEVVTFVSSGHVNCTEFAYWYPDNPALPVFTNPAVTNNPASTKAYAFPANGQFTVNSDQNAVGQSTTMYVVKNDAGFDGAGPWWGQRYTVHVVADTCANAGANVKTGIDGKCSVTVGTGVNTFMVPTGVTEVTVTAIGGTGTSESEPYSVGSTPVGGRAAKITAKLTVSPGDGFTADVPTWGGVGGSYCSNWNATAGTVGHGGGYAKVTINSNNTALLVAGGGGGAGCSTDFSGVLLGGSGGDAGLTVGVAAADGKQGQWDSTNDSASPIGSGATQSAGGQGYPNSGSQWTGGSAEVSSNPGGAGGGGYYGGGCGYRGWVYRAGSGGGGGSSYNNGFTLVSEELVVTGSVGGSVQFSFVPPPPTTVPDAPTIGSPVATGTTTANVPFTAPASDGGSAISYYILDSAPSANADLLFQAGSGTIPATGLTANTDYTFRVSAYNNNGYSAYSSYSATVTTWPNAPTASSATASSGALSVPFVAGAVGGGATITAYNYSIVATSPAGGTLTGSCGTTSPCVISGLTNGTTYSVTITAQNAGGSSVPSNAISGTPAAPGGGGGGGGGGGASAPTITRVKVEKEQSKVYFTPGSQSGITGYRYSINNGEWQRATGTSSPINIKVKLKRYALRIRSVSGNVLGDISTTFNVRD